MRINDFNDTHAEFDADASDDDVDDDDDNDDDVGNSYVNDSFVDNGDGDGGGGRGRDRALDVAIVGFDTAGMTRGEIEAEEERRDAVAAANDDGADLQGFLNDSGDEEDR
jgi:hypothetical protein